MTALERKPEPVVSEPKPAGRPDVNRQRLARMGWALSAPALLVIAAVTIFPIAYSIVMSFSNVTVTGNGFSLDGFTFSNYNLLIHASLWRDALYFTLYYTLVTVVVELIIGTCIALVLERLTAGRGWMMALLLIPWSMITVINAELWGYIYNGTYGVADYILADLGRHRADDRRQLEDDAIRGHHRAGRAGHAARRRVRGRGGGRLIELAN